MLERPPLPNAHDALAARFPQLMRPATLTYAPGSIALGKANNRPVALPRRPRFEHSHIIGTTGGGKTNLLEHLIRQDIKNGDGVCVIEQGGPSMGAEENKA